MKSRHGSRTDPVVNSPNEAIVIGPRANNGLMDLGFGGFRGHRGSIEIENTQIRGVWPPAVTRLCGLLLKRFVRR